MLRLKKPWKESSFSASRPSQCDSSRLSFWGRGGCGYSAGLRFESSSDVSATLRVRSSGLGGRGAGSSRAG